MTRLLLAVAVSLLAIAAVQGRAVAQESQTLAPTAEQKTINDPREYGAYTDALKIEDPAKKGAAMEAFAAHYPKSAVYADALQQAMAAYQAAGNGAKVTEVAGRLLKRDPKNVQVLAILAFIEMNAGTPASVAEAKDHAERGLKLLPGWRAAPGVPKTTFAAMRKETAAVFYDAIGLAALYAKDYVAARDALRHALTAKSGTFVENYRLAVAELEMNPIDPQGFWYIAKSIELAKKENPAAATKIEPYAAEKYKKYHGNMAGWDAVVASAERQGAPPKGFSVTRAAGN
jgi:tetratricopeptide (TPR) repeat protein